MSKGKTYKFFGSEFRIASGYATAQNITGATNASPCVITVTGHGLTGHGALKVAAVGGMLELNGRHWVFEVLTENTLRLVGCDSTQFGAYTSGGTIQAATFTTHCEETSYGYDSGATPVTEDETVCGVITNVGAPRLGTVSLGFKAADNVFQDTLEASQLTGAETAFRVAPNGMTKVRYDIGFVTQFNETGSAGGTWDGTASVSLTQARVKVAA